MQKRYNTTTDRILIQASGMDLRMAMCIGLNNYWMDFHEILYIHLFNS